MSTGVPKTSCKACGTPVDDEHLLTCHLCDREFCEDCIDFNGHGLWCPECLPKSPELLGKDSPVEDGDNNEPREEE